MGMPAAKKGDQIVAADMHMVQSPSGSPVLLPHPFAGTIDIGVSANVNIMGRPAATVNSSATNKPVHLASVGSFIKAPSNKATIVRGSATVFINGHAALRSGDIAKTCNDPVDLPVGKVIAVSTVMIG